MVIYSQKTFSFFPYRNQVRLSLTRFLVFSLGQWAELFSTLLHCMNCWIDYWMNLVQCFSNYVPWSPEDSNKWLEKLLQRVREKWVDTFLHPINQSSTTFSSPQTAIQAYTCTHTRARSHTHTHTLFNLHDILAFLTISQRKEFLFFRIVNFLRYSKPFTIKMRKLRHRGVSQQCII